MAENHSDLIESLVQDLKPVRRLRLRDGVAVAVAAGLAAVLTVTLGFGMRADLSTGHPDPVFLLTSGLFLVLAAASSWRVLEMGQPFVGSHRDGWVWAAAMVALLPASALVTMAIGWAGGTAPALDHDGETCLTVGTLMGLFMAAVLTLWLRRGAPASPERAGLLAGIAAGSTGIFAAALNCPHDDIAHIGIWHGATVVVGALLGRLLLPRLIRW